MKDVYSNRSEAESAAFAPELGASWSVAVLGGQIGFALTSTKDRNHYLKDPTGGLLSLPYLWDGGDRFIMPNEENIDAVNFQEEQFEVMNLHGQYYNELVPFEWIAKCFRNSHWHEYQKQEQILKKPSVWHLKFETPAANDQKAQEKDIVRVRIWKPGQAM
jgi:hypothetical protein